MHTVPVIQPTKLPQESELDIEQVKAGSEGRSGLLEDTSIHLTIGSECTFGGCYVDYSSFFVVYKIYWIEPVSCTISKLISCSYTGMHTFI